MKPQLLRANTFAGPADGERLFWAKSTTVVPSICLMQSKWFAHPGGHWFGVSPSAPALSNCPISKSLELGEDFR